MIGTEKIVLKGKEFLKVDLIPVNQKGSVWYLAKIPAKELLNLYTVRPAKYDIKTHSEFARTFPDEKAYYEHLISIDEDNLKEKDFQREANETRLQEIRKFLLNQKYAFFPNSIIATSDLLNDSPEFGFDAEKGICGLDSMDEIPNHFSIFYYEDDEPKLLVPYEHDAILVIDGQHRLGGLEKTDYSVIKEFELIISFIIGYDRSIIAKQFYTINYEQKPVNKSLLYQLTGEFSLEINELTFLHNVVKILNELDKSPFYKRIKMLGTAPKNVKDEEKPLLSISQAFLIDSLKKTISNSSTGGLYQPIFLYYYKQPKLHAELIKFLINYFSSIKKLRPDWNDPNNSLLSKGMGVGAFIKVMHLLFVKMFVEKFKMNPKKISEVDQDYIMQKLKGIENVDFSKEGPFGRSGSAGNINKIKEAIVENVNFFDTKDYDLFEAQFKTNYSDQFRAWLEDNVSDNQKTGVSNNF